MTQAKRSIRWSLKLPIFIVFLGHIGCSGTRAEAVSKSSPAPQQPAESTAPPAHQSATASLPVQTSLAVSAEALPNGMMIYKDPITGQFVSGPPPGTPQPSAAAGASTSLSTSTQGLTEVRSPGGGTMVLLQGRFQNTLHATVSEDGKVQADCVTNEQGGKR